MDADQAVIHPRGRKVGLQQLPLLRGVHQGVHIGGGVRDRAAEALQRFEGYLRIQVYHLVFRAGVRDEGNAFLLCRREIVGGQQSQFHRGLLLPSGISILSHLYRHCKQKNRRKLQNKIDGTRRLC